MTSENVGPNGADGVTIGDKKPLNRSLEQIGVVQPNQIPNSAMFIPTIVVDTLTNTNGQNSSELIDNLDVNSDNNDTRIDSDGDVSDF